MRHYRARGITHFFIAVADSLRDEVASAIQGHPVTPVFDLDVAESVAGTVAVSEMRRRHQHEGEWVTIVDLDEFVECPNLADFAARGEREGANVVRGIMYDRFTVEGRPAPCPPDANLADIFPVKARFVRNVMHGCDHKGVLVRGRLRPATGAAHHWFDDERSFSELLEISHYKWTTGALERLRQSLRDVQARGVKWASEYERALRHFDSNGRFAWESFGGRLASDFAPDPPYAHCSKCNGAISEAECAYSVATFESALCRTHQALRRRARS